MELEVKIVSKLTDKIFTVQVDASSSVLELKSKERNGTDLEKF